MAISRSREASTSRWQQSPTPVIAATCVYSTITVVNESSRLEEGGAIKKLTAKAKRKVGMHRKNEVYVMPVWIQLASPTSIRRQGE